MAVKLVKAPEYGRLRGVSTQAVNKAIKSGRIAAAVNENRFIDVDLADRLWAENTNPIAGEHGHIGKGLKPQRTIVDAAIEIGIDPDNLPTLVESKTIEAAYKAKLAKIEYEERSSILVEADEVKKSAFRIARLTRDAMLSIPDRLSAELAGMTEPFAIHTKLMNEIRSAIAEITKDV